MIEITGNPPVYYNGHADDYELGDTFIDHDGELVIVSNYKDDHPLIFTVLAKGTYEPGDTYVPSQRLRNARKVDLKITVV